MKASTHDAAGRSGWAGILYFSCVPAAATAGGLFLAPWMTVAALLGVPLRKVRMSAVTGFLACAAPLAALAAYAVLSAGWSPAPMSDNAWKIAVLFASGLLFVATAALGRPADRKLFRNAALAALLGLAAMLAIEALFDMPLNRWDQPDAVTTTLERNPGKGVSVLVALVWGGLAGLMDVGGWRQTLWRILFLATAVLSLQFSMNTNLLAFVVGGAAFLIAWQWPKVAPALAGLGLAGWMLAAPFVTPLIVAHAPASALPLSWQMRLHIWEFTTAHIWEKPLLGWGLDASRTFTDMSAMGDLPFKLMPLHPHSASLHIWFELGAVGAALAATAIAAAGFAASRTLGDNRAAAAAATGSAVAIGAIWNVSYGAFQEWWMVVPFVAAAVAATLSNDAPSTTHSLGADA